MNELRDAIELWGTCPKYKEYASKWIWYRLVSAYDNGKLNVYYDGGGNPLGFITYCFLTKEETETYKYYGPDAFKREDGDHLWFIDMVSRGTKRDVLNMCRDIRAEMKVKYPHVKSALSFRRATRVVSWPQKGNLA